MNMVEGDRAQAAAVEVSGKWRRAGIVALNTFREAVRDRVLYSLVFFRAADDGGTPSSWGRFRLGSRTRSIVTLGLSAISMIGLLIAVFIGVALVSKEMDKCTLVRAAGQAGPAMGVLARQIRRLGC